MKYYDITSIDDRGTSYFTRLTKGAAIDLAKAQWSIHQVKKVKVTDSDGHTFWWRGYGHVRQAIIAVGCGFLIAWFIYLGAYYGII